MKNTKSKPPLSSLNTIFQGKLVQLCYFSKGGLTRFGEFVFVDYLFKWLHGLCPITELLMYCNTSPTQGFLVWTPLLRKFQFTCSFTLSFKTLAFKTLPPPPPLSDPWNFYCPSVRYGCLLEAQNSQGYKVNKMGI